MLMNVGNVGLAFLGLGLISFLLGVICFGFCIFIRQGCFDHQN